VLKAAARQRLAAGQGELDLGLDTGADGGGPLPITSSRMGHLWGALACAYEVLGFDAATDEDEVFRALVLARIIEPTSKLDSLRVLEEAGIDPPSYPTLKRRLPVFATEAWRQALAAACAAHAGPGPASLVLYDVSTLYFETDTPDGFREPGFSKERRLDPQITIGLLTDAAGFPLMVNAFEGNKAETATMLPVIEAFVAAHRLDDVTIGADAGMISDANKRAIEAAGLALILGMRIPDVPYVVDQWRRDHPARRSRTGTSLPSPPHRQAPGSAHLLPISGRSCPPHLARHRSADRQGRESGGRADAGEAEPVHPAVRRHEEGQSHPGGQGKGAGRDQGLRHQPRRREHGFVIGAYHRLFQIEKSCIDVLGMDLDVTI
jgi:hypothetical protein